MSGSSTPIRKLLRRAAAATVAGAVALAVNFACLHAADALGIVTARGGFQRLAKLWLEPPLAAAGVGRAWVAAGLPDPDGALFTILFKVGVGLAMALAYAAVEPRLPGRAAGKGLIAALVVWLANAAIVLPMLGAGFAGSRDLTVLGMAAFALAHTAFFVVLAVGYERFACR